LETLALGEAFEERVLDAFVHSRLQGRETAPCYRCDAGLRLPALFGFADRLGAAWVATGHYAQIHKDVASDLVHVLPASDLAQDQSWYLTALTQDQLRRMLTPLGGIPVEMVRRLGTEFGLPVDELAAGRPTGGCLAGDMLQGEVPYIEGKTPPSLRVSGIIKTSDNHTVGEHEGVFRFRVGQRPGVQLGVPEPDSYRVLKLDPRAAEITVAPKSELAQGRFAASRAQWMQPVDRLRALRCAVRITAHGGDVPCVVHHFEDGALHVHLEKPQNGVAPGQPVAFYLKGELLGGAWIERVL
ncbi:MAG TPA: aminomethyltransferase beta-barrel domain-containing protein, partial [Bdellovibrionota bacterium]|nr:aminomethyltransferase beta-barrel domain-containing protein [Bdellovibrionota bacterium]